MSFSNGIRACLPDGMHLPDAFATTFDWLEALGWSGIFKHGDQSAFSSRYLSIYPLSKQMIHGVSYVVFSFEAGPPLHAPPEDVMARIVTLGKIAGDGGTLSLWLDDSGTQRIAVFNHGLPYLLTDDPLVALQFLAIGYPEPGAISDPTLTAAEQAQQDMADPPVLPDAFRAFLTETFGVTIPDRASDLGITIPDDTAPDPLRDWLDAKMPEPDPSEAPGMTRENPFIITRDLRDILGEEGIAVMRDTFKYVVEEE